MSADLWFASGDVVVANLSRAAVPQAFARYGRLVAIHVTAPPAVLAERLSRRGRESEGDIARRLARTPPLGVDPDLVFRLDNAGPVERAGNVLAYLLDELSRA